MFRKHLLWAALALGPIVLSSAPKVVMAQADKWPTSIRDFKFPFSGVMNDYWHGEIWRNTCGYGCYKHKNTYYPAAGTYSVDLVRDDGGSTTGSYVLAPARGIVSFAGTMTGYGYCVVMDHRGGWKSIVAHLKCDPNTFVSPGNDLLQGTLLGLAGNTGTETPHIHFSVWKDNVTVRLDGISGGATIVDNGRYCSGNAFVSPPKGRTTCPW